MKQRDAAFLVLVAVVASLGGSFLLQGKLGTPTSVSIVPSANETTATVGILSISSAPGANTAAAGDAGASNARVIKWSTASFPADAGVTINLLRKISDAPTTFELARALAVNVPNIGEITWTPAPEEVGAELYVEVTCATDTSAFDAEGCSISTTPVRVD